MMKTYDSYKDSGVEWIGCIPSGWSIKRFKYCIDDNSGGFWGDEPKENDNDIECIRVTEFDKEKSTLKNLDLTIRNVKKDKFHQIKVKKGSILIEKSGGGPTCLVGNSILIDKDIKAIYSNFITKIEVNKIITPKYAKYVLRTMYLKGLNSLAINQTTGIQNLNINKYLSEYIPLPNNNEQQQIADYLDKKTLEFDNLIAKKEELIETLKKSRQKLISETVTKGLDKKVELKDSGIAYIGKVPKHYKCIKLKSICEHIGRGKSPEYEENTGFYTMNQACLYWNYFKEVSLKSISGSFYKKLDKRYKAIRGDIFINSTGGGTLGKSAFFDKTGTLGRVHFYEEQEEYTYDSHVTMIRLKKNQLSKYFYYLFCTKKFHSYVDLYCVNGSTKQIELSKSSLESIVVSIPEIEEQNLIVKYLDKKTVQIDKIEEKLLEQIDIIKKAKQKLITEVVTGKIKVI